MRLRVQYTAQLRSATGCHEDIVELSEGSSIKTLLALLGEKYGDSVRAHLLTPAGRIQRSLLVIVNGIAHTAGHSESILLHDHDCIEFLPPIGGG